MTEIDTSTTEDKFLEKLSGGSLAKTLVEALVGGETRELDVAKAKEKLAERVEEVRKGLNDV